MFKPLNNKSLIFTTKNDELAVFGKTIDEIKDKWNDLIIAFNQGGIRGNGSVLSVLSSQKVKNSIIPESEMFEILSETEGKKIVGTLNEIRDGTSTSHKSMDDYLTWLGGKGKGYISDYVAENQNQIYTTEGVIASSKAARKSV